jgi:hypothetical protein
VFTFAESLHQRFAIAVLPAIWALMIVNKQPLVNVLLELFQRVIDFLAERNANVKQTVEIRMSRTIKQNG